MEKVIVKNVEFGNGIPKICAPIVGRTDEEVMAQAKNIFDEAKKAEALYIDSNKKLHVIEFRADYYDKVCDSRSLCNVLKQLRELFKDRILLFTYRSEEEGGELRHDRAENMLDDIYDSVISSGLVDMIDIELMSGNYRVVRNATKAHDHGITVIMSNHDFDKTPRDDELIMRFRNMEILGADILKIACMPKNEFDVRRLMELTEKLTKNGLRENNLTHPVVTMSMGKLGEISRVTGAKTGSAMTFVCVGQASAPGQIELSEMFRRL